MMGWIKKLFAASPENPSTNLLSNPDEWFVDWAAGAGMHSGGSMTDAGIPVGKLSAMRASAVFRCVSLIGGTVAGLPWGVYRDGKGGKTSLPGHYAYRLLHDAPNDLMTSFTFRELMMLSLLLDGNFYAGIGWDGAGRAVELLPFPSSAVEVVREGRKVFYRVMTADNGQVTVSSGDMIHVLGPSLDGIKGLSVISYVARQSIGLGLALETFAAKMHSNSARPSGAVEVAQGLSPDAFKRLRQSFEALYSGTTNSGKVVFLDNGMKFSPMQISPVDAQTLESRRFQVTDIARIFGVPPHLIGETDKSSSWGTGIEQMTLGFNTFTLTPWLRRIEQEFNRKIFSRGDYCEFCVEGLLRGDSKSRAEYYASAIQNGWMTPNEARRKENMPDAPGGDQLFIQSNLQPVDMAGKEPANADAQPGNSGQ